jgi:hypothetical protein
MTLLISEYTSNETAGGRKQGANAERRRGLRIRQARPVKIFEPAASRYFGAETLDISATGLRLELPAFAPLCEGEILNIHVGPTRSGMALANRRQMMPARVVWVDRAEAMKSGRISAGVEFLASISAQLDAA